MRRALLTMVLLSLFAPTIQAAQKKNRNRDSAIIFYPGERQVISDYFRNSSNLPPGLAKRGNNLPPGLQKQLRRNGQLPPGLQKRFTPFPDDLDRRLPRLPDVYRRGTIGNRAVIYDPTTLMILDMMEIFTGTRR
jgi:hypothetical protein